MLKIYAYRGCGTCRTALARLDAAGVRYSEIAIREQPPTAAELKTVLAAVDGQLKRLFNTSGQDYRSLAISDQLKTMTATQAIALLASNGNLCKRPVVVGPTTALVGYRPDEWDAAGL
jgi:arsenate reductase